MPEGPFGPFGPLDLLALGPPWARPALLGIGNARSEKIRSVFIRSDLTRVGGNRGAYGMTFGGHFGIDFLTCSEIAKTLNSLHRA